MSHPRSSSRADPRSAGAPRGPWPWLLAAGPIVVVVASLATAWLAIRGNDNIVADDYYKLGLSINRRLAAEPRAVADPGVTIHIAANGDVRVQLGDATHAPALLRLSVRRPGEREDAHRVSLEPGPNGAWFGVLPDVASDRRIVALESDAWRLPVTIIERLPATIVLAPGGHAP